MASPGQVAAPTLADLLRDGTFAGGWVLDTSRSAIRLRSKSIWGLAPVRGVFREFTGEGSVPAAGDVSGTISVAAASVDTGNKTRDAHLRSPDFFDVENHPDITVTVDRLTPSDGGVTVTGTLTVRGQARPLTFPASASIPRDGEVLFDAEIQVDRSQFGLTWNRAGMASMHSRITIHAAFIKR
jgi:polyisoprenoid-binding protein YceI